MDIPLGILPLGTLNHFARDLGVPTAMDEAVALIAAHKTEFVDVADINGETFVNNSSIGIYPYLVLERERRRRRHGLSKWTAMILAAFRVLRHLPLRRLSISAEGSIEPYKSPSVFIGNNEYSLTAPAFGRREKLDAGELCIYVAKSQSRPALLRLVIRALLGFSDEPGDLRAMKVRKAEIRSRSSRLLVALDGEVTILRPPLHYRTRPGALRVFVPADPTG
jgi:diacylglycerol kinase family enzyme